MPISTLAACDEILAGWYTGKAGGLWSQTAWVQLQFHCLQAVSLGYAFKLSGPQFPHVLNEDHNHISMRKLWWGSNELPKEENHFAQFMVSHVYSTEAGDCNYTPVCTQITLRQNDKVL